MLVERAFRGHAWRDPDAGTARRAPHHGPGSARGTKSHALPARRIDVFAEFGGLFRLKVVQGGRLKAVHDGSRWRILGRARPKCRARGSRSSARESRILHAHLSCLMWPARFRTAWGDPDAGTARRAPHHGPGPARGTKSRALPARRRPRLRSEFRRVALDCVHDTPSLLLSKLSEPAASKPMAQFAKRRRGLAIAASRHALGDG